MKNKLMILLSFCLFTGLNKAQEMSKVSNLRISNAKGLAGLGSLYLLGHLTNRYSDDNNKKLIGKILKTCSKSQAFALIAKEIAKSLLVNKDINTNLWIHFAMILYHFYKEESMGYQMPEVIPHHFSKWPHFLSFLYYISR